jgi:NADPH:quinone reductase-like Zn-dependent oxidoreductase
VRKLLKPGGKIALFELTEPDTMKTNFAFGLLPGWWRAADEYRDLSAGVSEDVWHKILVKAGFSGIDLSLPDYYDQECHEHSALISTALEKNPGRPNFPETIVILDEGSSLQNEIGLRLQQDLGQAGSPSVQLVSLEQATLKQDISRTFCIFLLEAEQPILRNVNSKTFLTIRDIISTSEGVLWMTRGGGDTPALPDHAMVNGLVRTVKQESIKTKFVTIAFEPKKSTVLHITKRILEVYAQTMSTSVDDCEPEYVERDGRLCIDRFVEADYLNRNIASRLVTQQQHTKRFGEVSSLALSISSPGLLDTLEFIEDKSSTRPLDPDEIEIKVQASGVNFRDCLIALGRIPSTTMGFECAGTVLRVGDQCEDLQPGDRVCANAAGTYQTYARCKAVHAMPLPGHMSFLEGAALPVVFTTAYYALYHVARITDGESILIHSGAGGTGQAAIQIAKLFNADIYVTVGSDEKKKLLMDLYHIPEDHIFYSRNASFAQGIRRMTRERGGVDIVLNSLSGDALVSTWECMAPFGRFLEIGKKDILANGSLPMFPFAKNVSFHAIDLNEARQHRPRLMQELKDGVVSLLFGRKIRPAQPLHVYGIGEVEKAFRYLQSGKNTGKTVVELRQEDMVKVSRNLRDIVIRLTDLRLSLITSLPGTLTRMPPTSSLAA